MDKNKQYWLDTIHRLADKLGSGLSQETLKHNKEVWVDIYTIAIYNRIKEAVNDAIWCGRGFTVVDLIELSSKGEGSLLISTFEKADDDVTDATIARVKAALEADNCIVEENKVYPSFKITYGPYRKMQMDIDKGAVCIEDKGDTTEK